jgi:hypothetical protein
MQNAEETEVVKSFPTTPDGDGYFFESDTDEQMGIRTKIFENGSKTKTVTLPDGKVAVVRELIGRDTKSIARFQGNDQERYVNAAVAVATTIDGKPETFEYYQGLKLKTLSKLISMCGDLNF